jgi:hypothetical protein
MISIIEFCLSSKSYNKEEETFTQRFSQYHHYWMTASAVVAADVSKQPIEMHQTFM